MSASLLQRVVRKVGAYDLVVNRLTPEQIIELQQSWEVWARPDQLEPDGDWRVWLILAGRGWGKSRVGAETVRKWALDYPGCHIALVAKTAADARDVMVRALLSAWKGGKLQPGDDGWPNYEPSKRSLSWKNGSYATTYSAEEPNQLRGPQHDFAWVDELSAMPNHQTKAREVGARSTMEEVWHEGVQMGLRGTGIDNERPRCLVTTTPRPSKLLRELIGSDTTRVTRGSTFDNATNLPAQYIADIKRRYEGTRLGRQELHAEILDDVPGALWTLASIDDARVDAAPELIRVGVGVDPSGTTSEGNEQGIVVCGVDGRGHGYVLEDCTAHGSPDEWGKASCRAYIRHKADFVLVERNFGGDMCRATIEQAAKSLGVRVNVKEVVASRGKIVRAEPVSALYEQGKVHHVGIFPELEEQMRSYVPGFADSPDRMDALVWVLTKLMVFDVVTLGDAPVTAGERRNVYEPHDDPFDDDPDDRHGRW